MTGKALAGVKVVELCQFVAGPYCSKLLADLGAEVVKVEEPGVGDKARKRGPFPRDIPHPERSGLFLYLNTNKLGITLNLNSFKGREIFRELVRQADILVEDNPLGRMKELGLDYQALKELNPALIMTSITPFGQTGPYKHYKSYPLSTFHAGGEGYLTPGWGGFQPDRPPLKAGKYVGDYESGIVSAVSIMGALYWQRSSGLGQYIDISKQQALIALNSTELRVYPNFGGIASRASRVMSFGGILPCKDGYVEMALYEEHQWRRLVELMGNPEWAKEERFKDRAARSQHGGELNQLLAEWLKHHTKEEVYHKAQALGVPLAPYHTTEEVVKSRQMRAREFFVEVDHPEAGNFKYPSAPYRFSRTPWVAARPAPLLGQHNEEVYSRLGYGQQDLIKLRQANVI